MSEAPLTTDPTALLRYLHEQMGLTRPEQTMDQTLVAALRCYAAVLGVHHEYEPLADPMHPEHRDIEQVLMQASDLAAMGPFMLDELMAATWPVQIFVAPKVIKNRIARWLRAAGYTSKQREIGGQRSIYWDRALPGKLMRQSAARYRALQEE